ncbi:polysaccharide deacetylase family protein [Pseudobutyrivibrio ruminis]|uniref:NodB homology domain-containing protein n=1 Tax=Pseudobutyrivibrio ruminis TaxID=46206 RepID=A0A2G3DTS7_9FIRM|nr:polysaccharide deacetylase family protein [Pseudobutyrivibrio ruminis]PHU34439.1 hypothetical protein CSX01_10005 [Pseudobutyrivibrio ruminis]
MNAHAHGIMFHHFHGEDHVKAQGSLSAEDFDDLLTWYGKNHNIICAEEFYDKAINGKLGKDDVVLTFDDALLCQYDIAVPVMKDRGLTGFWFVYTSPLTGVYEKLEIYHHFRFSMYQEIDEFYSDFFKAAEDIKDILGIDVIAKLSDEKWRTYKLKSTFYTDNDRKFRYARDSILGLERYNQVMETMMVKVGYEYKKYVDRLWIREHELQSLHSLGHIIGLHSHTHPTTLGLMDYEKQKEEYSVCKQLLEGFLPTITTVSYPCDSINEDTKEIMQNLGVKLGFRAYPIVNSDPLFIPREDHSNLFKIMKNESLLYNTEY